MKILNKNVLQLAAAVCMLLDHLWASIVPGNNWMTYVGRMAFPIFAFLITEGYVHTSNRRQYAKRLLLFALLSEIPFNLFYIGSLFFPFHQNAIFTLLLGFWAIERIERFRESEDAKGKICQAALLALILLASVVTFPDYGIQGVFMVISFHVLKGFRWEAVWQLASMVWINLVLFEGMSVPVRLGTWSYDLPTQGFAVLALLPIWMYNGKAGAKQKILQYGFYAFYPLHMLVLYCLRRIM